MQVNKTGQTLDSFAVITVASTTGYVVGEKVTGGTTGATAKVSGIFSATELLVKSVKPGATTVFTGTENIVGNKSATTSAMSAFAWGQKMKRHDGTGAQTTVVRNVVAISDKGVTQTDARGNALVTTAIRMHQSKTETPANDAATVPVFTVKRISSAKTYSVAKAAVLRVALNVNEAVEVTGVPQIAIVLAGDNTGNAATRQLSYVADKSSLNELVFEYTLVAGDNPDYLGQIVSIANTWTNNSGSIKDRKSDGTVGSALTPSTWTVPSVTGIIVGA